MIHLDALSKAGLTNKILKRIMTAEPPKDRRAAAKKKDGAEGSVDTLNKLEKLPENPTDWDVRCYLETICSGEINEGLMQCAEGFDRWMTMDLAYTAQPVHPAMPPLMKSAMGYIDLEKCAANVDKLSTELRDELFQRDAKGKVVGINRPKLIKVSHNLVHSLTTRRVAALATELYQQFPVMKYDPFSNNQTGRCVADVMTQIAEQMAGAYGYRHDYEESIRHASLYTDCIKFKERAWHVEKQTLPVPKPKNGAKKSGKKEEVEFERKIIREGVTFVIPHPTRRYFDSSRPLSKANHGLGPKWGGHWEVVRVGSIKHDPAYWNTDKIAYDMDLYTEFFGKNAEYFTHHYAEKMSMPPELSSGAAQALKNDRMAQIGAFAELADNVSTVLHQHFKQVIPKDVGLGTYEDPVWIRFVFAGRTTCVYAEIVGSEPWSVNSYNASDAFLVNPSFGLQALQWQEMVTNLLNELRHVQAQGLIRIFALNTHGMKKAEIEAVVQAIKDPDYAQLKDVVIQYDAEKMQMRAQDTKAITQKITQIKIETAEKVTEIFNNIVNTLALAERIMFFSPQELGQVSARTTSATEQKAIRETTLGIRDFHLIGVKQQIEADKRIIHSSYMAFGSDELEVPVAERYERSVIEAAGFEIVDDGSGNPPDGLYTIRGKKLGLYYNYTYSSRNTDDLPPDATVAQGIAQVYEVVSKDPFLSENTTLEQRMELANSLFKILSPGVFKLRVPPGKDGKSTQAGAVQQMQQTLQQALPQIMQALQTLSQKQASQDANIQALAGGLQKLSGQVAQSARPARGAVRGVPRGQVFADTPAGVGAPAPRGVIQPRAVPALPSLPGRG